jgi:hypothetical protein
MAIGDVTKVAGYITQDKFLAGRSLEEIERYLGFHKGRLAQGASFIKLARLPKIDEFELAAYSMTAAHRYTTPPGLDIAKLKNLAMARWSLSGPDRLVKVRPGIQHDVSMGDDEQYPPGSGVPQWRIKTPTLIDGVVVAEPKTRADVYKPLL